MKDCPRCEGGCSIVCCALCEGVSEVTIKVYDEYKALGDRYVGPGEAIEIREANK